MSSLRLLQEQFQAYLMGEESNIELHITDHGSKRFAEKRLAIYGDAYYLRLIEILKMIFPAIFHYLGEEAFEELGYNYLLEYPSSTPFVHEIGKRMSQFIAEEPYAEFPFLNEMAAFEQAWQVCSVKPNAPVLSQSDLLTIPEADWPQACFVLHPTVQTLTLHWNIPALWSVQWEPSKIVEPIREENPRHWLIWRKELTNYYIECSSQEAQLLQNMIAGQTFAELCQNLGDQLAEEEIANYIVQRLLRWLNDGLLSQIWAGAKNFSPVQ